jgi:hypothetical protein
LTQKRPEPDAHRCRVTSGSLRTSGLARKLQTVIRLLVQQITSNALGGGRNDSFLHPLSPFD